MFEFDLETILEEMEGLSLQEKIEQLDKDIKNNAKELLVKKKEK